MHGICHSCASVSKVLHCRWVRSIWPCLWLHSRGYLTNHLLSFNPWLLAVWVFLLNRYILTIRNPKPAQTAWTNRMGTMPTWHKSGTVRVGFGVHPLVGWSESRSSSQVQSPQKVYFFENARKNMWQRERINHDFYMRLSITMTRSRVNAHRNTETRISVKCRRV